MKVTHIILPTVALVCNVSAALPAQENVEKEFITVTKALFTSDPATLIKHSHPKFRKFVGGDAKFAQIMKSGCAYMKNAQVKFVSAKVKKQTALFKANNDQYFFIQTNITISSAGNETSNDEIYLVIKSNEDSPWSYLKVADKQLPTLKQLFPKVDFTKAQM